jgi:hypothetical protein
MIRTTLLTGRIRLRAWTNGEVAAFHELLGRPSRHLAGPHRNPRRQPKETGGRLLRVASRCRRGSGGGRSRHAKPAASWATSSCSRRLTMKPLSWATTWLTVPGARATPRKRQPPSSRMASRSWRCRWCPPWCTWTIMRPIGWLRGWACTSQGPSPTTTGHTSATSGRGRMRDLPPPVIEPPPPFLCHRLHRHVRRPCRSRAHRRAAERVFRVHRRRAISPVRWGWAPRCRGGARPP